MEYKETYVVAVVILAALAMGPIAATVAVAEDLAVVEVAEIVVLAAKAKIRGASALTSLTGESDRKQRRVLLQDALALHEAVVVTG